MTEQGLPAVGTCTETLVVAPGASAASSLLLLPPPRGPRSRMRVPSSGGRGGASRLPWFSRWARATHAQEPDTGEKITQVRVCGAQTQTLKGVATPCGILTNTSAPAGCPGFRGGCCSGSVT